MTLQMVKKRCFKIFSKYLNNAIFHITLNSPITIGRSASFVRPERVIKGYIGHKDELI